MKSLKANAITVLLVGALVFPMLASAAAPSSFQDLVRVVQRFISWIFALFILLAVIFVLYAAFKYLVSGGDSGKVGEATNALVYAAVAIGVALIAASIQFIVGQLMGVQGEPSIIIPDPSFII